MISEEKEKTKKVISLLTSRRFHQRRKGFEKPKPGSEGYKILFNKILNRIEKRGVLQLVLGYGHHKNIGICGYAEPDEAEKSSLAFLAGLAREIKLVYPLVTIYLVTSGARAEFANGSKKSDTIVYHKKMEELIKRDENFSNIFQLIMLEDIWAMEEKFSDVVNQKIAIIRKRGIIDEEKKEALLKRARRNSIYKDKEDLLESVFRFQATFMAEKELRLWEKAFPGAVFCSYRINNLVPQDILLFTLKKGCIMQPWECCRKNSV